MMNATQLTDDDLMDLDAVASRSGCDWRTLPRASELDDHGAKLIGLGHLEVRVPARHGVAGSERLGATDAGLDVIWSERARIEQIRARAA